MINIFKFIRDWSLSARQFLLLLVFAFLILSFLQISNTINTAERIRQNELALSRSMAEDACRYLDHLMDSINGVLISQGTNWRVFLPGREKEALELLRHYNNYGIWGIRVMYFYRNDGLVLCGNQVLYDILGNAFLDNHFDYIKKFPNTIRYSNPYYTYLSGNTIAACSAVKDSNDNFLGVLIVEFNIHILQNALNVYLASTNSGYVLFTPDQEVITYNANKTFMPTIPNTWPPKPEESFLKNIASAKTGFDNTRENLIVYNSVNNKFGWHLAAMVNTSPVNNVIAALYRNMVLEMLGYFFILSLASFGLTFWLMRPIRTMVLKMRSIKTLSDLSEIEYNKWGEVGKLTDSFNFMMRSITQLKNDCQSYELKMLRSQIGPHFLYNTLSCISLMAQQRRVEEVQSTIRSLIDLLSFSFDRQDEFVTLNDEIKSVENYIDIQKMRLGLNFTFTVNSGTGCGGCLIPKLTLQPVVENAILHGLVPKAVCERQIYLRAKCYRQILVIIIADNGIGMTKETIGNIMESEDNMKTKDRFSGIGIHNVDKRIKLYYGERFGVKIRSCPGIGTIVRFTLPVSG